MKIRRFDLEHLSEAVAVLRRGGVVILPTETVYGVACLEGFPEALERIRAMKHRDAAKPFQLLAAEVEQVWADGAERTPASEAAAEKWPGALTLVLPTTKGHTEGYRVPDHTLLRKLIADCGGLLRCTSVNLSGEPPAKDAQEAAEALGNAVDLVLDGGPARLGQASTVALLQPDDTWVIARQGTVILDA